MDLESAGIRFGIDPLKLDEEWVGHPQMVYNAAAYQAEVEKTLGEAKSNLKRVYARLSRDVRDSPGMYGLAKVTEQSVADVVLSHEDLEEAEKAVIEAQYAASMAGAACNALEHRKRGLTLMVELWRREYYSDPSPRGASEEGEEFGRRAVRRRGIMRDQRESKAAES